MHASILLSVALTTGWFSPPPETLRMSGVLKAVRPIPPGTLLTRAKVLEVGPRSFAVSVGTEPLSVDDGPETHYWKSKAPAKREAFAAGDDVWVRVKTDNDPPVLKEIADVESQTWLDKIRKEFLKGTIDKVDSKRALIHFDDGTSFDYRATEKTVIKLKGKTSPSLSDLTKGDAVWVKGRLLSNLDTWLAEIRDEAPRPAPDKSKPAKSEKVDPLPPAGTLLGNVLSHLTTLKMFDI
ncbi:MAG: hypothetical protein HZC36_08330 [Armatimonadetes bacterium]|nr:hypothetical protein [Armatimonadota bacterium]